MLLDDGKNRTRDLLDADLYEGQVGTGTTAETSSDTSLETPVAGTNKAVTTTTADKQLTVDYNLGTTEGNGNTLSEYGLNMNSGTDMLTRVTFYPLAKQSTEEWQITTVIFIP